MKPLAIRRTTIHSAGLRTALRQRASTLTEREAEVMGLTVRGKTNREIAELLCISYRPVEIRRSRVMVKLKVSTLAELLSCALALSQCDT